MVIESRSTRGEGGRLGTWRNPPLAYVIAELRISPHYSLSEAIPQLQSTLRDQFPRTLEGSELVIDPSSPPTPQRVWQLIAADAMRGIYVSTRSIALHATAYVDFADFVDRWNYVLDSIRQANLNPFVERAGLRYLDLIVPSGDRQPRDYLMLGGVRPIEGAVVQSSLWGATFSIDGFTLQTHTAAPSPEGMLFAPNFNVLQLQKPPIMNEAEERMRRKQPIGYIDTDCWRPVQQVFDAPALRDLYVQLHDRVSEVFRSLLADIAVEEWR